MSFLRLFFSYYYYYFIRVGPMISQNLVCPTSASFSDTWCGKSLFWSWCSALWLMSLRNQGQLWHLRCLNQGKQNTLEKQTIHINWLWPHRLYSMGKQKNKKLKKKIIIQWALCWCLIFLQSIQDFLSQILSTLVVKRKHINKGTYFSHDCYFDISIPT